MRPEKGGEWVQGSGSKGSVDRINGKVGPSVFLVYDWIGFC